MTLSPQEIAKRQEDWDSAKAHIRIEGGQISDELEQIAARYIRGDLDWDSYEKAYLAAVSAGA